MNVCILSLVIVPLAVLGSVQRGQAFDVDDAFPKGGYVLSIEGGYGEQFDLGNATISGLDAFNAFAWGGYRGARQAQGR